MTQTAPSGPTSDMIGAHHSSSLARRLVGLVERKVGAVGLDDELANEMAGGLVHERDAVPVFLR